VHKPLQTFKDGVIHKKFEEGVVRASFRSSTLVGMLQLQKINKKRRKHKMDPDDKINDLVHYRKRMRFTQLQVMSILGWKNKKGLTQIESGKVVPTLTTALKLAIIYRVPVEFLFANFHRRLLQQVRSREQSLAPVGQRPLPLAVSNRP